MAAAAVLPVIAIALQGKIGVRLTSEQIEQLSLYTFVVAESGERKSPVYKQVVAPLVDYQIANPSMTLYVENTTPEALVKRMADNNGTMAVISDEGSSVISPLLGLYSSKPVLQAWLNGHSGGSINVDRISRDPDVIPSAHLSSLLMMQPEVLNDIMACRSARECGLLARILFALPAPYEGRRVLDTPRIPEDVKCNYSALIFELLNYTPQAPVVLEFDGSAYTRIGEIYSDHEDAMRTGNYADVLWHNKYIGTVARIAGILHMCCGKSAAKRCISRQTLEAAKAITDYFAETYEYLHTGYYVDMDAKLAEYIFNSLMRLGGQASESELKSACKSRFDNFSESGRLINLLYDRGYVDRLPAEQNHTGRPKSDIIVATDAAMEYQTQKALLRCR